MKKKLKIALFISPDPSKPGGVQEHSYFLAKSLIKLGHHVSTFGPKPTKRYPNYVRVGDSIAMPMPNGEWADFNFWSGKKPSEIINRGNFDICHIQEPLIPFINWELFKNVLPPKVVTFHFAWDKDSVGNILKPILPHFKKTFSSYVSGAIFVSRLTQKRMKTLCKRSIPQQVILNGLDHTVYFPPVKKIVTKKIQILFLARLIPKKGPFYLIKAFNWLKTDFPNLRVVFIGEGSEKNRVARFVQNHNLSAKVTFKGVVSEAEKRNYYQNSDIFCAPYVDEGYGLTVLESMACGCPFVGFKNDAFKQWLKAYPRPELLVKPKDWVSLTKALKVLITNTDLRSKLSAWCVKESQKYNWDETAKQTEQFYYKVLAKNK